MSAKTSAEVVIDGKVYTLSGYEGEEYLQKVASYINGKINEFTSIEEYRHIPLNMKNTLIQLNIADDIFIFRWNCLWKSGNTANQRGCTSTTNQSLWKCEIVYREYHSDI